MDLLSSVVDTSFSAGCAGIFGYVQSATFGTALANDVSSPLSEKLMATIDALVDK
jgi:hypothetical protein